MSRPPISLGDLVRAAGVLSPDAATLARIAALLGLAVPMAAPAGRHAIRRVPLPAPAQPAGGPRSPVPQAVPPLPVGEDPRPARQPVVTVTPPVADPPRLLRGSVEDLLGTPAVVPVRPEPLLPPGCERAVLAALASVPRPGREVDVDRLVALLAARQPVSVVPRLPEATTRLGVRLLVDQGPSMRPYLRDLGLLAAALRHVVGAVEITPLDIGLGEGPLPRLAAGTPVLAATDLGIGTPPLTPLPEPARWLSLARAAREVGAPLVVLNPYPPGRWPGWAAGLAVVRWDRPTDTGQAVRVARRAAAGLRR